MSQVSSLQKVLIANRGEIACRVIRTCHRLGIDTVALFSDADRNAMHASMAGEAFHVGPSPASQSYLDMHRILDIAATAGADGVHPGYGFLSENSAFSQACAEQGVAFIGPPVGAIEAMGSKSTSKNIMIDAGVPVTPGYHGDDQSVERLLDEAKRIKFPVLIKATLGGGGKGMRLVEKAEDFEAALDACKREALKSFNDDTVLLERFVSKPRHVEFQVFGDSHGNVVHLHERDCSVQRRHQKVLEESPSPGLTWDARNAMGEAAVNAAKAVGYVGAGTVEFLVDSANGDYFFCEMNTRLQVEHPVTEMVTGLDLVEWQLAVAAGNKLPITDQDSINDRLRHAKAGHAIEARVYAENPLKGFLPATGKLLRLKQPVSPSGREFLAGESDPRTFNDDAGGGGAGQADVTVRVDTGVREGDEVTMFYDPMISKLIVHAPDRPRALHALQAALKSYQVSGLPTNLSFLQRCASHPAFLEGQVTTAFLDEFGDDLLQAEASPAPPLARALAAVASLLAKKKESANHTTATSSVKDPFYSAGSSSTSTTSGFNNKSWRAFGGASSSVVLVDNNASDFSSSSPTAAKPLEGADASVSVKETRDGVFEVAVAGEEEDSSNNFLLRASLSGDGSGRMQVELLPNKQGQGMERSFAVDTFVGSSTSGGDSVQLWAASGDTLASPPLDFSNRQTYSFTVPPQDVLGKGGPKAGGQVRAPMPGKVLRLLVSPGDEVKEGQPLLILEAMKMEHVMVASRDGIVKEVHCSEGVIVTDGAILAEVDGGEEDGDEKKLAA